MMTAFFAAAASAAPAATDEIVIPRDNVIQASINGQPVRLRVDPGAPLIPVLNPELIARLQVKAGPFPVTGRVGPVKIPGKSAVLRFGLPGAAKVKKARVLWFGRAFAEGADGAVSPLFLPQNRVRFELGGSGGRTSTLPLANLGGNSAGAVLPVAGEPVQLRLTLWLPHSSATADAGRLLAQAHAGKLAPGGGAMPVAFGITRPWRELKLGAPAALGPFSLSSLRLRVPDAGMTGIPDEEADPDEIVVTGDSKVKPNRVIGIGRDQLDRCAWLEMDRKAQTIRFDCPA